MTTSPTPAPLSEEDADNILYGTASQPLEAYRNQLTFYVSHLRATITARDETIAGLTRERDAQYAETVNQIHQVGLLVLRAEAAEFRLKRLEGALRKAISVANEARDEWDAAPSGMRAGKLLIALSGGLRGYRADIDSIHAALASDPATTVEGAGG